MSEHTPKKMGSRALLRAHFLNNVGKIMDSDELREVAGISEWARRVRELRNEEGYLILTHNDRNELKPGEYLLPSLNLPSREAFQKNSAPWFWIATASHAKCAEP